jgi:hypothetical protein
MTFWLSNRLFKQLIVLTHPTRRAKTRFSTGKAAVNYCIIRGGWDDSNCARPPSTVSLCGVREHRDCPSYLAPCFSRHQVVTC